MRKSKKSARKNPCKSRNNLFGTIFILIYYYCNKFLGNIKKYKISTIRFLLRDFINLCTCGNKMLPLELLQLH
jgi:hypothetical protein